MMIKVLLCSPREGAVGGISIWTRNLLDYYENQRQGDLRLSHYYESIESNINIKSKWLRLYKGIKSYFRVYIGLLKTIEKEQFDVVHFCSSGSVSLIKDILFLYVVKNKEIKTIIHYRFGRIPDLVKSKNWEYILLQITIRLAYKVIVIDSESFKALLNEQYGNVFILPNPLTPKITEIIMRNNDIVRDNRKVLFAGHCILTKGIFELIDACRYIENINLKMIGYVTDEMRELLLKSASNTRLEWLEVAGELNQDETIKEMLSAGVFVLPSYTEGFPNVILESMGCGCPIVATAVGAIPEMLNIGNGDKSGICVEPKNVDQLKRAIEKMLKNREYALECGNNARNRVHNLYSMDHIWGELLMMWK